MEAEILPRRYEDTWFESFEGSVAARVAMSTMDLTVAAQGLETRAKFDSSHCDVSVTEIEGASHVRKGLSCTQNVSQISVKR